MSAHLLAAERAPALGFRRYIVSATTPFHQGDLERLRDDAPEVVRERVPGYEVPYRQRSWKMFPGIERVYVNERARNELGWLPQYDFSSVISRLNARADLQSPLARAIGAKGYHHEAFSQGPYPVDEVPTKA